MKPVLLGQGNSEQSLLIGLRVNTINGPTAIKARPHGGTPSEVIRKSAPLGLTEHPLHKATLPRLWDIATLPNIYKQIERQPK